MAAVEIRNPQVLWMPALLTVTAPAMKPTIDALEAMGAYPRVKVLIGGVPVAGQYAKEVDTDGYSENAGCAVSFVRRLAAAR